MANKPENKYAKTWQQLSHALGQDMSPKSGKVTTQALNKSQPLIAEFIRSKFCPPKNPPQKGWVIEEVRTAFVAFMATKSDKGHVASDKPQNQKDLPPRDADSKPTDFLNLTEEQKVEARKSKLQKNLRIYLGIEPAMFPLRKFEIDELAKEGMIPPIPREHAAAELEPDETDSPAPTSGAKDKLAELEKKFGPDVLCDTQHDLAWSMDSYYHNADGSSRLRIKIDDTTFSDWKNGRRLHGSPTMPARCNSRQWSRNQYLEWFEKRLYSIFRKPMPGEMPMQGEMVDAVALEQMRIQDEVETLQHNAKERALWDGKYKSVEIFNRNLLRLGALLNQAINNIERDETKFWITKLEELGLPDAVKVGLRGQLPELCRGNADNLRQSLAKALKELKVKEEPDGELN